MAIVALVAIGGVGCAVTRPTPNDLDIRHTVRTPTLGYIPATAHGNHRVQLRVQQPPTPTRTTSPYNVRPSRASWFAYRYFGKYPESSLTVELHPKDADDDLNPTLSVLAQLTGAPPPNKTNPGWILPDGTVLQRRRSSRLHATRLASLYREHVDSSLPYTVAAPKASMALSQRSRAGIRASYLQLRRDLAGGFSHLLLARTNPRARALARDISELETIVRQAEAALYHNKPALAYWRLSQAYRHTNALRLRWQIRNQPDAIQDATNALVEALAPPPQPHRNGTLAPSAGMGTAAASVRRTLAAIQRVLVRLPPPGAPGKRDRVAAALANKLGAHAEAHALYHASVRFTTPTTKGPPCTPWRIRRLAHGYHTLSGHAQAHRPPRPHQAKNTARSVYTRAYNQLWDALDSYTVAAQIRLAKRIGSLAAQDQTSVRADLLKQAELQSRVAANATRSLLGKLPQDALIYYNTATELAHSKLAAENRQALALFWRASLLFDVYGALRLCP